MSKFQIALTGIFIVFIIAGVTLFATYKGNQSSSELPPINVWGTFNESVFNQYVNKVNVSLGSTLRVNYTQISENNFDKVFIEALARGQGPDAVLIPQDLIARHQDKIIPIPFDTLSERDFKNTFIQQAELYLTSEGSLALPFAIDPLVMYWNRDLFTNAGLSNYPKFWDEFALINSRITVKDLNANIRRSAIALGQFSNILHAREILGTLFLQSGNPVTYKIPADNGGGIVLASSLGTRNFNGLKTSLPAIEFFTQFSNPSNPNYSWNRSLPNSKSSFLSGNLATYFGFASEISDIKSKNVNLNFDVAAMPQPRGAQNRSSYGSMYGFSIVRSTGNALGTFSVITSLLSPDSLNSLIEMTYLPPVRRDMIGGGNKDPYLTIFYDSALISKGWLDTNREQSNRIFQNAVESIISGKKDSTRAVQDASDELDISLQNT